MKNIRLYIPKLKDYWYEQKLQSDPKTMSYNAGWDVNYYGYHYDTGCIDFPESKWEDKYNERKDNNNIFFAYILDTKIDKYVGYVNYRINDKNECHIGIVIEDKYRGKGYARKGLKLLCSKAFRDGIDKVYDEFEYSRKAALKLFKSLGFKEEKKKTYKRYKKDEKGVVLSLTKEEFYKKELENLKTPEDRLLFMDNIEYGYLDNDNNKHLGTLKGFRTTYRTLSIEEILDNKIGTCIEQVYLMKYLLDKIGIPNKMFCTRIYEPNTFNDMDADEHMHCFVLYYLDGKVYHIEHPNKYKVGIYEYDSEEEAIKNINEYYVELSGGIPRPLTEFYKVESGLSFKEFNNYINSIDGGKYERN